MPAIKHVTWFFLKICAIYAFFFLVNCEGIYSAAFRACGNAAYENMGNGGRIRLVKAPPEIKDFDIQVKLMNTKIAGARGTMEIATRKTGYLPAALTIALILATPIPFKRRLIALAIALAIMECFVLFQFYLRFVEILSQPGPLQVYNLSSFMMGVVTILVKSLSLTPVTSYIIPVVIWAMVILRKDQVAQLTALCRGEKSTATSGTSQGS